MYSMTGYGRGEVDYNGRRLTVEFKSVNHRFMSLVFKSPRGFAAAEDKLRNYIKSRLLRGHIEVYINLSSDVVEDELNLNLELCDKYFALAKELSLRYNVPNDFSIDTLMKRTDVYKSVSEEEDPDKLIQAVLEASSQAVDMLIASRASEGEKISRDLVVKVDSIEQITEDIKCKAGGQIDVFRDKLQSRITEVLGSVALDEQRLMNEIVFYADRVATDEEFTRLIAHVERFREVSSGRVEVGKTLDVIAQEMLREANTIGSKCSDSALCNLVINLKGEIEKVREQVQNIE